MGGKWYLLKASSKWIPKIGWKFMFMFSAEFKPIQFLGRSWSCGCVGSLLDQGDIKGFWIGLVGWESRWVRSAWLDRNLHCLDQEDISQLRGLPRPSRPSRPIPTAPTILSTMLIQDRFWRWFCDADPNLWMLIPNAALWHCFDSIVSDTVFTPGSMSSSQTWNANAHGPPN